MVNHSNIIQSLPDGVTLKMNGRYGALYYKKDFSYIDIYVELSGVPQYQLLIWFKDISHWTYPSYREITQEEKSLIKEEIIIYLEKQGISSDIYNQ